MVMTDEPTSDATPPRRTVQVRMPSSDAIRNALAEQEKRQTASERAMRDLQLGTGPKWDGVGIKGPQGMRLGGSLDDLQGYRLPNGFAAGLVAAANSAVAPSMKGISASVLASIAPVVNGINATALAGLSAQMEPGFKSGTLTSDYFRAATASIPRIRPDQFLSPSTVGALRAAQLSVKRFDFEAMTDRPAGVLGRFDSAIHVDLGLGAAVDSLIAAPTQRGPVGFDYGAVQRHARQVEEVLDDSPASADLAEAAKEAQEATGLDDEQMLDFSQLLGIPASHRPGAASAAKILFITTVGTSAVVLDLATGHLAPSGLLFALLLGRDTWNWLREGRKPE